MVRKFVGLPVHRVFPNIMDVSIYEPARFIWGRKTDTFKRRLREIEIEEVELEFFGHPHNHINAEAGWSEIRLMLALMGGINPYSLLVRRFFTKTGHGRFIASEEAFNGFKNFTDFYMRYELDSLMVHEVVHCLEYGRKGRGDSTLLSARIIDKKYRKKVFKWLKLEDTKTVTKSGKSGPRELHEAYHYPLSAPEIPANLCQILFLHKQCGLSQEEIIKRFMHTHDISLYEVVAAFVQFAIEGYWKEI